MTTKAGSRRKEPKPKVKDQPKKRRGRRPDCSNCGRPKSMCTCGRPTKMTKAVLTKLEIAFAMGAGKTEACVSAGIARQTLENYITKYPSFLDRIEELKDVLPLKARKLIADDIEAGNVDRAVWYLEKKKKKEFGSALDLIADEGVPIALVTFVGDEKKSKTKDS